MYFNDIHRSNTLALLFKISLIIGITTPIFNIVGKFPLMATKISYSLDGQKKYIKACNRAKEVLVAEKQSAPSCPTSSNAKAAVAEYNNAIWDSIVEEIQIKRPFRITLFSLFMLSVGAAIKDLGFFHRLSSRWIHATVTLFVASCYGWMISTIFNNNYSSAYILYGLIISIFALQRPQNKELVIKYAIIASFGHSICFWIIYPYNVLAQSLIPFFYSVLQFIGDTFSSLNFFIGISLFFYFLPHPEQIEE
jgi:hypothetical protein